MYGNLCSIPVGHSFCVLRECVDSNTHNSFRLVTVLTGPRQCLDSRQGCTADKGLKSGFLTCIRAYAPAAIAEWSASRSPSQAILNVADCISAARSREQQQQMCASTACKTHLVQRDSTSSNMAIFRLPQFCAWLAYSTCTGQKRLRTPYNGRSVSDQLAS